MQMPAAHQLMAKLLRAAKPGQTVSAKVKTSVKVKKSRVVSRMRKNRGYRPRGA